MRFFLILLGLGLIGFCGPARAQLTVTPTQGMDFGSFVIRDFNVVSQLVVHELTGVVTADANTILLGGGQNGQFSLTGGPASSAFTVTLDATVPLYGAVPVLRWTSFLSRRPCFRRTGRARIRFLSGCGPRAPAAAPFIQTAYTPEVTISPSSFRFLFGSFAFAQQYAIDGLFIVI